MFYYSLPVLWPTETAKLFVPADETIRRGAYATITNLGTWGKSFNLVQFLVQETELRRLVAGLSLVLIFSRLNHERWQIIFCIVVQIALTGSLASISYNSNAQAVATVFILSCFVNQPLFLSFIIISLSLEDQADM